MKLATTFVLFASCGGVESTNTGPSGFRRDESLADLTTAERRELCEWSLAEQGGPGTVHDCEGDADPAVKEVDVCIANNERLGECGLTVGEYEDCVARIVEVPCAWAVSPECAGVAGCLFAD